MSEEGGRRSHVRETAGEPIDKERSLGAPEGTDRPLSEDGPWGQGPVRSTEAVVDLTAIGENLAQLRRGLRAGVRVLAVVKADAYGHGSAEVARKAIQGGATGLCVALPQEARQLRTAGVVAPILVLGPVRPDEARDLALRGVAITVAGPVGAEAALQGLAGARAADPSVRLAVHVKVDTGMGRLGLPAGAASELVRDLSGKAGSGLDVVGVFSHLSSADDDPVFTREQIERFAALEQTLRPVVGPEVIFHLANSAGAMAYPDAQFDAVRLGIALYGYDPMAHRSSVPLKPALSLRSRVSFVKRVSAGTGLSYGHTYHVAGPRTIATVPVGYADGVRRALTGQTVLVKGERYPIVGRVTMDQILLEGPADWSVGVGDPVTLLGQDGQDAIWADAWAQRLGTIPYEILTGLSPRVPRRFTGGS